MQEEKQENQPARRKRPPLLHPFFQYAIGLLLVLLIVFVFYQVAIELLPFFNFITILFAPLVISLLFYYLLRPIVRILENYKIPRALTILGIYLFIGLGAIVFIAYIAPILSSQVGNLVDISTKTWEKVSETSESILLNGLKIHFDNEMKQRLLNFLQQTTTLLSRNLLDFISFLTRLAAILIVIPFILFYLLKDDRTFISNILKRIPEDYGYEIRKILQNMDETLANYITGLVLVSSVMGGLLFIGYLIIGLNSSLVLSLMAIIFMTIPFLGSFLAIMPAIFVALSQSSWMVMKVIIVFIIVQQFEANILSPQIIGQRLNIHPLTIILLLLVAGSLFGLAGLFLVTPLYALSKVLIEGVIKIYQWHYLYSQKNK